MKGALGLLAIAAVVWVFWMTYVIIKRTKDKE
jgi:hypothetical protein